MTRPRAPINTEMTVDFGLDEWDVELLDGLIHAFAQPDLGTMRSAARELRESISGDAALADFSGLLAEVEDLLRADEVEEASSRLDTWLHPKWGSSSECQAAYDAAMREMRS